MHKANKRCNITLQLPNHLYHHIKIRIMQWRNHHHHLWCVMWSQINNHHRDDILIWLDICGRDDTDRSKVSILLDIVHATNWIIPSTWRWHDLMIDRDDDWSMIDERAPPLTKLCDPATQIEISYHDRIDDDWSTIDIYYIGGLLIIQFMIIWDHEIVDGWLSDDSIWPRVHEQKSRSSLINRSMGWTIFERCCHSTIVKL